MLTDTQKEAVNKLIGDGYENAGQIAKMLGLCKEYVEAYINEVVESVYNQKEASCLTCGEYNCQGHSPSEFGDLNIESVTNNS